MNTKIPIRTLTERIIDDRSLLDLYLWKRKKYREILHSNSYAIDPGIRSFFEQYDPYFVRKNADLYAKQRRARKLDLEIDMKSEYKKLRNEILDKYMQHMKDLEVRDTLLADLLHLTRSGDVLWKKMRWKDSYSLMERDFVTEHNRREYTFCFLGKRLENGNWNLHYRLKVDGALFTKESAYYSELYDVILKQVTD